MLWWLGHSRPVMVLLIAAVASGCANPSIRPTQSDQRQDRSKQPPASEDRGRARPTTEPPIRSSEPRSTQEPPQPQQPQRPSENAPPQRPDEPDPRAVIDWLLKERR